MRTSSNYTDTKLGPSSGLDQLELIASSRRYGLLYARIQLDGRMDLDLSFDGRMDLDISFDGRMMTTAVYLKMDAKDSLLLSEGVCCQLKIILLHPAIPLCCSV